MSVIIWLISNISFLEWILKIYRKIHYKNCISPNKLDFIKNNTGILFIDDETGFSTVKIFKQSNWNNTHIEKDIANIDSDLIVKNDIFFVDINGVGKKLKYKDGGQGLCVDIKKRYPEKKVIIYSADEVGGRFNEALRIADECLPKNVEPKEFLNLANDFAVELFKKRKLYSQKCGNIL